ncbi:Hpt domain-containing protein [Photobacterium kishitanii]|uniref:Hpt domain-containing protein n=1 Tax=Photobacterium kishitanii TaxID=318456 RepID=UPI002738EC89|nr:Hpt domain-containing protein [Photobacterium kishitanii]
MKKKPQLTESEELLPLVKESVLGSDLQVLGVAQVKQLISLFGESASKTLVTLHQAIAANDLPEVAKQAHTLKGAAGTMGLMQLHQLCLVFEKISPRRFYCWA